jgi:integrase
MSLATNIVRRGARYAFRVRVPSDLVSRFERSEIIRSLKTTDPGIARRQSVPAGACFHTLWDTVREDATLSRNQIDELIRASFENALKHGSTSRPANVVGSLEAAEAVTLESGDPGSGDRWSVGSQQPLFRASSTPPAASVRFSPRGAPVPKERLSELVERFLKEKPDIAAKSVLDYRAAIRVLEQTPGVNQDISRIRLSEAVRLKDMLLKAPANWTKRFVGKTLIEAIRENEKSCLPTLSVGTINGKYLSLLSTFFKWALMNGLIEKNPMEGVRVLVPKGSKKTKRRLPFTSEQLQAVFSAPVFTGSRSESKLFEPGIHRIRDHRFWTPLIALWSGARLNEIGQLLRSDVRETDGIQCFHFIEDADGEQKRLKSEAARRVVPIHPELEKLGFLEYVQGRSESSGARLFPHWKLGKDGYYSSGFSKWFGRFLSSVNLKDPRLVFHSFRHGFKDALRRGAVEERIQDAIMGHEPEHASSEYGLGYAPAVLYQAMNAVNYLELDLTALHRRGSGI